MEINQARLRWTMPRRTERSAGHYDGKHVPNFAADSGAGEYSRVPAGAGEHSRVPAGDGVADGGDFCRTGKRSRRCRWKRLRSRVSGDKFPNILTGIIITFSSTPPELESRRFRRESLTIVRDGRPEYLRFYVPIATPTLRLHHDLGKFTGLK